MTSPAHQQYLSIKQRYHDAILLFRMGDFYEMFGEDAKTGAVTLGITLTSREFGKGDRVPMCGIPHHALQGYLKRFVDHGLKVAICEQLSEPGRGLVERDVVKVVTPGTLNEPALLQEDRNNYLAAVHCHKDRWGLAYVDVTTGEFALTEFTGAQALSDLETDVLRLAPSECLVAGEIDARLVGHVTIHDDFRFDPVTARDALCRQFGVQSLEGFGCADMPAAVGAAGAIVSYVERSNRSLLAMLTGLRTYQVVGYMPLDRYTRRNLELTESTRSGGTRGSLLWVLDHTRTAMGGRLLRRLIGQPMLSVEALDRRLDVVEELFALPMVRTKLRTAMATISDLERLTGRICQGVILPHELHSLRVSLNGLVEIRELLAGARCEELIRVYETMDPCSDVSLRIEQAVNEAGAPDRKRDDNPLRQGVIKSGYHAELDGMRAAIRESRDWIAHLETVEQQRTGIKSLKVGYNKIFGYYIEVSNANVALVPEEYIRKQTLVNAERYITPELKEHEARILQAEDRINAVEKRVFAEVLDALAAESQRLFETADALAHLDVYRSLADVAGHHNYVRPRLSDDDCLVIAGGRHPVVEVSREDGFIANDTVLDCSDKQVLIITGPNMGGKSTYLRQVALIVLMAQIGSFVPADRAQIGIVDRIFTRVGAQDDIAAGQSTFMVEMVETANILNHATARSLLILDEVGRGTSTYDGLAIARAVVEYIHDYLGSRTLFATHYHELTGLADQYRRIHNVHAAVAEDSGDVIFLHRLVPGGADRSYGIHVARLAGLPAGAIQRAEDALHELEAQSQNGDSPRRSRSQQLPLFGESKDRAARILEEILDLHLETLTPLDALTRLHEIQVRGRGAE